MFIKGILSNDMKSPSQMLNDNLWPEHMNIYNENPLLIRLCTELNLLPNLEVSI